MLIILDPDWAQSEGLLFVATPVRRRSRQEEDKMSIQEQIKEVAQKLAASTDDAEKQAFQTQIDNLVAQLASDLDQANSDLQVTADDLATTKLELEAAEEKLKDSRPSFNSVLSSTRTSSGDARGSGGAASAQTPAGPPGVGASQVVQQPSQQRQRVPGGTLSQRIRSGQANEVVSHVERMNRSSYVAAMESQGEVLLTRPTLLDDPTVDMEYALVHDQEDREDLKQEKNMMQKIMVTFMKFTGEPDSKVTWEMFDIQMSGLRAKGMFKERELSVLMWGLTDGQARLILMSNGLFKGSSYTAMYECLEESFQRDMSEIMQDIAACTQGPAEMVTAYAARFRIVSSGLYPKPVQEYRALDHEMIRNPMIKVELVTFKALFAQASLTAQHHFARGLRQDIRRQMSSLHFETLEEAVKCAKKAEKHLEALGDMKYTPNPLNKPQINMMQAKGNRGNPRNHQGSNNNGNKEKFEGECFKCGKYGHRKVDCWSGQQNGQRKFQPGSKNRSQQEENQHVQGAMNAVQGQVHPRSSSGGSQRSFRGRSASPRGRSPRGHQRKTNSGSSAKTGRQGRGTGQRNRDHVSFNNASSQQQNRKGRFNAMHGDHHDGEDQGDYDSGND